MIVSKSESVCVAVPTSRLERIVQEKTKPDVVSGWMKAAQAMPNTERFEWMLGQGKLRRFCFVD